MESSRVTRRRALTLGLAGGLGLVPLRTAGAEQPPKAATVPAPPINVTVTTTPPAPDVSIALGSRSAKVTPVRSGHTHTGGGNIDVQQPAPDTVTITMMGVAVAYGGPTSSASASQVFDLVQQFEVSLDKPGVKAAKITIEGRLIGFLRCHKMGSADVCAGATVTPAAGPGLALLMPAHEVCGDDSISINDREAPDGLVVRAGKFTFNQTFKVSAAMPKCVLPCKAPSAEFAPDPALDPLWISPKEPFKGAKKADLGFQVIIKLAPEVPAGK